jgi:hypothetical protein
VFHSGLLQPKASRSTQGVAVLRMKPKYRVTDARCAEQTENQESHPLPASAPSPRSARS